MTKAKSKPAKVAAILTKRHDGLSLANVDTDSITVEEFDYESFEVILPAVTLAILKTHDYDHEVIAEETTQAEWDALDEDERDRYVREFQGTLGYDQWRDGFNPIMLYYWPVALPHGANTGVIVDLFERLSIACSLLEIHDDTALRETVGEGYAIVLTGGGMNLCDHLVAAYLACGNVPPTRLLTGLTGVISERMLARIEPRLKQAFASAEGWMQNELSRIKRNKAALFGSKREGVNAHA